GKLFGAGLDARLFTDLSTLSPEHPDTLQTPTDRFYVRTAATSDLRPSDPRQPSSLRGTGLARLDWTKGRSGVGPYLMECAGNSDPSNYGLISSARWAGLPMPAVLERLGASDAGKPRVLVEGQDPSGPSVTSVPGASWIFPR